MRDIRSWRTQLMRRLREHWPDDAAMQPADLCDVELGLFVMQDLAPAVPVHALWALLIGYPFPTLEFERLNQLQRCVLGTARHLLPYFRGPYQWRRVLGRYQQLPEQLRAYDIDEHAVQAHPREVSICADRQGVYADALGRPPPHRVDQIHWAQAGTYVCFDRERQTEVRIPTNLIAPRTAGHVLSGQPTRPPIVVRWEDLLATARWMDAEAAARGLAAAVWEQRLQRVQLELVDSTHGALVLAEQLTLDKLVHLIGMVSSGKSTLMDVLAVWTARQGLHVTLVVSDVMNALNRAQLFLNLGIAVAPILGASNRKQHTNRLHRILSTEQPLTPLLNDHAGFRWLSTTCPLDGLRAEPWPFQVNAEPCLKLYAANGANDADVTFDVDNTYACPLYSVCPTHQAQRDLVQAAIWIATPASLVYTRVALQINAERIRYAELVYRRSDLVIIDEADLVQVQLDSIFSPNQTLVSRAAGGADAWLGRIWQQVIPQLNLEGRGQLREEDVDIWCHAHEIAQTTTNKIYALLLRESALREWVDRRDYFTDWLLFDRLATKLSGVDAQHRRDSPEYRRLIQIFETYLEDPLGERHDHELAAITRQATTLTNAGHVRAEIAAWIVAHRSPAAVLTAHDEERLIVQFEFALLVAVLQDRIDMLFRSWKQVEVPLKLDRGSSMLFHHPPDDYAPVIPAAPMGNVLAFQYVRSLDNREAPGELRFFRCMGVGRWLLLHLHELFAADGIAGPHVLLMSGTSWAGTSPGYHIQAPVTGVLRAPAEEVAAIERSTFRFLPFHDRDNRPITVSGARGGQRDAALKELLYQLARTGGLGGPSILEQTRDRLPPGRQRMLILVGSYDEARRAHAYLRELRPDWRGQMVHLVPDDDEFESQWRDDEQALQRGLVYQFARTGAWLLIAPLLAVERGHNILNERDEAAIGAAYFLVRPHPRPDDISYAIHAINRWAVDRHADVNWLSEQCQQPFTLDRVAKAFRDAAYRRWRSLLRLPMVYSTLPDWERVAVTWTQLVTIWQVIGRLVRGGQPAQVFFCDAAFARQTAAGEEYGDVAATSLLVSAREVLRPYFEETPTTIPPQDRALVQALYGPFYRALAQMGGLADATL